MVEAFEQQKIAKCPKCLGLVKPDIVFFGEQLPTRFFKSLADFKEADLLIIIGTSLTVFPFANLITLTPPDCPRVFINLERVNNFDQKRDDIVLLGRCDQIIELLSKELGWHEELLKLWNETEIKVPNAEEPKPADEEVKELAEAISKQMKLEEVTASEKPSRTDTDPAKDGVKSEATKPQPSDLSGPSLAPEGGSISGVSKRDHDHEALRPEETLTTKGSHEEEKQKAQQGTPTSEDKQEEKQEVQDEAEIPEGKL
jgi:NAD-dependent histone deacetylase SIR2